MGRSRRAPGALGASRGKLGARPRRWRSTARSSTRRRATRRHEPAGRRPDRRAGRAPEASRSTRPDWRPSPATRSWSTGPAQARHAAARPDPAPARASGGRRPTARAGPGRPAGSRRSSTTATAGRTSPERRLGQRRRGRSTATAAASTRRTAPRGASRAGRSATASASASAAPTRCRARRDHRAAALRPGVRRGPDRLGRRRRRWPWVTRVRGINAVSVEDAPSLADLGIDNRSMGRRSRKKLDGEQRDRLLRLLGP